MCSEHHDGVAIMMMLCHTMCGSNITQSMHHDDVVIMMGASSRCA